MMRRARPADGSARTWRSAEHGFTHWGRSAENGFTSSKRSAEQGFTLVELMVVITVIGLLAGVALLAIPDPRGRLVEEASRFGARVRAVHDAAIIEARPMSLWVSTGGYGFDAYRAGKWVPIAEKPLTVTQWGAGVAPQLLSERDRIVFDETGLADRPLALTLRRGEEQVTVRVEQNGEVRLGG